MGSSLHTTVQGTKQYLRTVPFLSQLLLIPTRLEAGVSFPFLSEHSPFSISVPAPQILAAALHKWGVPSLQ